MIRRIAHRLAYWWAAVCYVILPRSLWKVSPRHDPVPAGTDTPPTHPMCRCALVPAISDEAQIEAREIRDRVQRLIMRPMVQRGELIRGGDPATGRVNMWLTDKGMDLRP